MNEINEPWQNKLFIGHQPIISQLNRLKNNNSLTIHFFLVVRLV